MSTTVVEVRTVEVLEADPPASPHEVHSSFDLISTGFVLQAAKIDAVCPPIFVDDI
jgi:hypothetical protein